VTFPRLVLSGSYNPREGLSMVASLVEADGTSTLVGEKSVPLGNLGWTDFMVVMPMPKMNESLTEPEQSVKVVPSCCVCGTMEGIREDGWYGYRCGSADCLVF